MTTPIYTNGAASKLSQPAAANDLVLFVDDTTNFPFPNADQHYLCTLVGACNDSVEIVLASSTAAGQITLAVRGLQDTVAKPFAVGDMIYSAITAGEWQSISNSFRWYLGPHSDAPTDDGAGGPLLPGHYYYDTDDQEVLFWSGTQWLSAGVPAESYLTRQVYWAELGSYPAGTPLPTLDVYGNSIPVPLDPTLHLVRVELNGVHLIEQINPAILVGDYTVDYALGQVTPLAEIPTGATVVVTVHINSKNQLYMEWMGDWVQQEYLPQQVVKDGDWTMVAINTTTDRAAPTTDGPPVFAIEPTPTWVPAAPVGVIEAIGGHTYTFTDDGWLEAIRVWVPVITGYRFTMILEDITVPATPIERRIHIAPEDLIENSWATVITDHLRVKIGTILRISLRSSNDAGGDVAYVNFSSQWASFPADFATVVGFLEHGGVVQPGNENAAFGIDFSFQKALISEDWEVVAITGNGKAAGGTGSLGLHNDLTGREDATCHPMEAITGLNTDLFNKQEQIDANTASLTAPTDGAIYGRQGANWVVHNELKVIVANTELIAGNSYYDDGDNLINTLPQKSTLVEPAGIRIAKGDGAGISTLNAHVNDGSGLVSKLFFKGDYVALLLIGGEWVVTDASQFEFADVFLAALQDIPDSELTKCLYDQVRRDTGNGYISGNYAAQLSGLYGVNVHTQLYVQDNGLVNYSVIRVNDSAATERRVHREDDPAPGADENTAAGYFELEVLVGDEISYWAFVNGTQSGILGDVGGAQTTMSIRLLKQL